MAVTQSHFRFGTTEGTESTHGWHAAEDTNPAQGVIANDTTFLLRITEQADASGAANYAATFQYRKNGGTWTNITTSSSNVKAVTPPTWSNGAACTKRLSGTGTFETSGAGCTTDGTSGGTQNDIAASGNSETEIALQIVGANVAHGDTIDFQIITASYSVYPSLTVDKPAAQFVASVSTTTTVAAALTIPEVARDTSTTFPKVAHQAQGSGTSLAVAAFNVPSGGRLMVATALWASGNINDPGLPTITDNQGTHLNWTLVETSYWTDAYWPAYARIWVADAPDAITGLTVTTQIPTGGTVQVGSLTVDCLSGAETVANVLGGVSTLVSLSESQHTCNCVVAAGAAKSWITGIWVSGNTSTALTADSNTTPLDDHFEDTGVGMAILVGHRNAPTDGAGNFTVGTTLASGPYVLYVAAEIKIKTPPQAAALQAAVATTTTVAGALTTAIALVAAVTAGATVDASLGSLPSTLVADVQSTSEIAASLTTAIQFAAAVTGTTTVEANLTMPSSGLVAAVQAGMAIYSHLDDVPPAISPASGVYTTSRTVTITQSGGSGRTIRYTTDGSRPTAASTAYSGSFSVNATGIVRAALFTAAGEDGPMSTVWYAIESTGTKIGPDHVVRTDGDSKLISWLPQEIAYGETIKRVARSLLGMALDTDAGHGTGYPRFLFHSYLNADLSPATGWPSAPGGQIGMLLDSAIQAYPYTGDASLMAMAKMLLAYLIKNGSTPATGSWQRAIYNEADPDEVPFIGAGDNYGNAGVGDGQGNLEPDKQAEIGWGALQLWKHDPTQTDFRDLAIRLADQLCANRKTGTSASVSPWPFRTTQANNTRPSGAPAGEDYCSNLAPYLRLFDDLIALGIGSTSNYQTARNAFWTWATTYPLSSDGDAGPWGHYFEDQPWSSVYTDDANNLNPNNMARLLLERPSLTSNYLTWAANLATYVEGTFGDTAQYGAVPINEQDWYMYPMGSHTSRMGAVRALLYAANSSSTDKDKAYRALNWTTYMNRTDGYSLDGYPSPNQVWMTDGFGDTIRHFAVAMYAVPEWSPAGEDHLLGSTSVVQKVRYRVNRIEYQTYDAGAYETLRLSFAPTAVSAGGSWLTKRTDLNAEGWTWDDTAKVLRVRHDNSGQIVVRLAASLKADVQCTTTVAASMVVPALLAADVQATSTIAAVLTTQIRFVAAVAGASTITGALTTAITAQAAVSTTTTVAAALSTSIRFVAGIQGATTVAGSLTTAIRPVAAVTTSTSVDAALTTAIRFVAAVQAGTTVEANLMTGSGIAASVQSSATVAAALTTAIRFVSAVTSRTTIEAALTLPGAVLQAAISSSTVVAASLTASSGLVAAIAGQTTVAAVLTTSIRMAATVATTTNVAALLSVEIQGLTVWLATELAEPMMASVGGSIAMTDDSLELHTEAKG